MTLADKKGITKMAYRKLHDKAMKIVHGKSFTKSPILVPFNSFNMGKNMNDTEQVAMSIEVMRLRVETAADYQRE